MTPRVLLLALTLTSLIASSRTEERAVQSQSERAGSDAATAGHENNGSYPFNGRRSPGQRSAFRGAETAGSFALIRGLATWYCGGGSPCTRGYFPTDYIAAVDPGLGIPRGTLFTVRHGGREVLVRAVDVCGCSGRRIRDLSRVAFSRLASPSAGVIAVTVTIGAPYLPNTDMETP